MPEQTEQMSERETVTLWKCPDCGCVPVRMDLSYQCPVCIRTDMVKVQYESVPPGSVVVPVAKLFRLIEVDCSQKVVVNENTECRHRREIVSGLGGCLCRPDNCFRLLDLTRTGEDTVVRQALPRQADSIRGGIRHKTVLAKPPMENVYKSTQRKCYTRKELK